MNSDEAFEHILRATDGEPDVEPRRTERTLRQFSHCKGYRATYEIFNGRYLEVCILRAHAKPRQYTVDRAFLSAQPTRRLTIAWRILAVALVATAVTALLAAYVGHSRESAALSFWLPMAIFAGTVAMVVGLLGLHRCSDRLLFHSEHGDVVSGTIEQKSMEPRIAVFCTGYYPTY